MLNLKKWPEREKSLYSNLKKKSFKQIRAIQDAPLNIGIIEKSFYLLFIMKNQNKQIK